MNDNDTRYTVAVFFEVDPAQAEAFKKTMLDSAKSVRASTGNRQYDLSQSRADPTHFMLYETFDTEADWERHHDTPEIQDLLARIKPMLLGKPDRSTWTSAAPV